MSQKSYDLEERTFIFAKEVRNLVKKLPQNIINTEDIKQVVRSSGSVGANYIEANEALSKKILLIELKFLEKKQKKVFFGYVY